MSKLWSELKKKGPVLRACVVCGREFEAVKSTQLYCSVKCNCAANAKRKSASKYRWRSNRVCKHCGAVFVPKTKSQKFCSNHCKTTWVNANRQKVEKVCAGCGAVFTTRVRKQKYCSASCATAHTVPTIMLKCVDCGRTFSHYGRSRSKRCPECSRLHWSIYCVQHYYEVVKNKRYAKTLFDKPVETRFFYRKLCYAIWPRRCVLCGEDYVGKRFQLDVHHIDCNPTNDTPENLVPLCRKCHRRLHIYSQKNGVSVEERLFELWPNGRQEIGAAVQQWAASHTANSVNAKPLYGHANTELSDKESVETVHGASQVDEEPVQTTTGNTGQ